MPGRRVGKVNKGHGGVLQNFRGIAQNIFEIYDKGIFRNSDKVCSRYVFVAAP